MSTACTTVLQVQELACAGDHCFVVGCSVFQNIEQNNVIGLIVDQRAVEYSQGCVRQ